MKTCSRCRTSRSTLVVQDRGCAECLEALKDPVMAVANMSAEHRIEEFEGWLLADVSLDAIGPRVAQLVERPVLISEITTASGRNALRREIWLSSHVPAARNADVTQLPNATDEFPC